MATGGKSWAVVMVVAVLSRLMSTDGRPQSLQLQQQMDRAGYLNPEMDIDRAYQLMSDKQALLGAERHHHQQAHGSAAHSLLTEHDVDGAARSLLGSVAAAGAAAVEGASPVRAPVAATGAVVGVRNATTAAVRSHEPNYHYEVHSVQHNPIKYGTAERKLEAVVRLATAVENRIETREEKDARDTLIDDTERHNQQLLAARRKSANDNEHHHRQAPSAALLAAAKERQRLEQIRHLEDERDQEASEADDAVDYEEAYGLPGDVDNDAPEQQTAVVSGRAAGEQLVPDKVAAAKPNAAEEEGEVVKVKLSVDEEAPVALRLEAFNSDELPKSPSSIADVYFFAVVIGCSVAGIAGFMSAGVCWYRLQKKMKEASEVDYPAYGVTGPVTTVSPSGKVPPCSGAGSPGDRKLAQSAQMYHYQHQKQQMIASERLGNEVNQHVGGTGSDAESEEENEDGDYTVFECPGLATNGEMEVRNPMFSDPTPVATPGDTSGLYQQSKK